MTSIARRARVWVGLTIIVLDVLIFAADAAVPLLRGAEVTWGAGELTAHALFLFLGLHLINPKVAGEFFEKVGKMLPWTKAGK